ncbi:MAG: ATP-binding cassette domain-containing protein [Lachnospiraceae bacterium]|nr:ATP-binding cassette domain-containing protein [Lachnospiraceae bacterium]
MEPIIKMEDINKEFKVVKRREGVKGSIRDLFSREYSILHAVNNVSLDIMPGEMVGYLGPNGAGKSTTIKMMTGILEPTSGKILVNGRVPYENRTKNAQDIGVVFGQRTQLWWSLPVIESFKILKEIYRIPDKEYKDNLEYYDALVDAGKLYHKAVREMSLGQRTLCDILAAFLHNPGVVFMDEPTIGLDVSMKGKIRQLVGNLNEKKGTTVILTTHDMGDVDALCKRIVIIDKGTMIYDNDIAQLQQYFGAYRTLKIQFNKQAENVENEVLEAQAKEVENWILEKYPHVKSLAVSVEDKWINILLNEDEVHMMDAINCIQNNKRIVDMNLQEISTESVIRKIYEGGVN